MFAELLYFKFAKRYNIIDKPNNRSSHANVTLRGGGIVFYISILLYIIFNGFLYWKFFVGLSLITFISFYDDIKSISQLPRLFCHFVAIILLFSEWNAFNFLSWYWIIIALVISAGIINAYNFMDGINGITGGYSLVVLLSLGYVNYFVVNFIDPQIILYTILSIIVFIMFNFRKRAKCFAGDVGSVGIAFIVLFILGSLIMKTQDITYLVLIVVYGIDTILTIIHRIILKQNIGAPHRMHVYQILANELKFTHIQVSLLYMFTQVLISIIFLSFFNFHWLILISSICILSILYILFMKSFFKFHSNNF